MPGNNALDTLRLELKFIELGLYRAPTPGSPLLIFEDSPACPRYGATTCPSCVLMRFVPSECRFEPVPCHHIRLNDACETVDSLFRTGTQQDLEDVLRNWLTTTIKQCEQAQSESQAPGTEQNVS